MSKISQAQKVIQFLQANPMQRFGVKAIADALFTQYPEDYLEKLKNPRFAGNAALCKSQISAEIGAQKNQILRANPNIFWQDKPRPRVYWYDPNTTQLQKIAENNQENEDLSDDELESLEINSLSNDSVLNESQLYPLLIEYLKSELNLYCQRINEKRSKNQRGNGGNQWLHPDIVAMQPVDKVWHELVRTCVGQRVRLWSFEVKKELNSANVRKSFFQAVSNSSWANEGYLAAIAIADNKVEQELRMLSALHGIGVILLNPENPSESEILLPAIARPEIDWQSVDRIVVENEDFKDFIELVSTYYQTGRIRGIDWNKV